MKLLHLSDLHLGKRVNGFSMLEDQEYILHQILEIVKEEKPDGVLIAGDVYDKAMPGTEAVRLFDDFLYNLSKERLSVFVISGNHDSPERVSFGSRLMDKSGVYLSPVYGGHIKAVTLEDSYGPVHVWLLPFLKPSQVRRFYPEAEINTYTDALKTALSQASICFEERNVLVTHQFVTGALRSDSEELSVGGADNVDAAVFEGFDYVALGHIHRPQKAGRDTVRYCGTPLKYSFSEAAHEKSATIVELKEKGKVEVRMKLLKPRRDLREIRGTYMELTARSYYEGTDTEDYLHVTLTDEEDVPEALGKLRAIYPNLMKLDYDNRRTSAPGIQTDTREVENRTPLELFAEFYEKQNNQPMSEEQSVFVEERMKEIWEDDV